MLKHENYSHPPNTTPIVYENSLKEKTFGPEKGLDIVVVIIKAGCKQDQSWMTDCFLGTLATDATSQLDVLGHDSHTLGMNGTQVGILKQTNEVSLGSFLESHDSRGLEAEISLEILSNFTHQALERQFPDQKFGALLITPDLTESHGSRPVTVGLLDTSSGWSRLASCLRGKLLAGRLAAGRLASRLLGTSHCSNCCSE